MSFEIPNNQTITLIIPPPDINSRIYDTNRAYDLYASARMTLVSDILQLASAFARPSTVPYQQRVVVLDTLLAGPSSLPPEIAATPAGRDPGLLIHDSGLPVENPRTPAQPNPSPSPTIPGGSPMEGGASQPPIPWDIRILQFFISQLQDMLDFPSYALTLQHGAPNTNSGAQQEIAAQQIPVKNQNPVENSSSIPSALQQNSSAIKNSQNIATSPQTESAAIRFSQQNQGAFGMQVAGQIGQTAVQNSRSNGLPNSTPSNPPRENPRQLLAEMALKLLSINQLSQNFVAQTTKSSQQQEFSVSSRKLTNTAIMTQVGKLVTQIEELKGLLQQRAGIVSEKFFRVVIDRLKEITTELQITAQTVPTPQNRLQKEATLERLNQEVEWLTTLLVMSKGEKNQNELGKTTVPQDSFKQESSRITTMPKFNETGMVVTTRDSQLSSTPSNIAYFLPTDGKAPIPLPTLIPKSPQELAGMIQMHLNKSVMQPLPLIIPFPVSIGLSNPLDKTMASEREKQKKGDEGNRGFGGSKEISQLMLLIPAGPVIIGDPFVEGRPDERPTHIEQLNPFLISATQVTNAQYAAWLSDELANKSIHVVHPGRIFDANGRLLAMTVEGAITSQLEFSTSSGALEIRPVPGRENHPVVHVTYYGAQAFCIANGLRLPTEAEWERAAGMMPTEYGQPLKKLRYACLAELMSPAWAIYRETGMAKSSLNLTMPVGFFDGQKVYSRANRRIETNRAISPWGCSDMSGNVREWTSSSYDEDGLFIITKGGSFADAAFDLRVAAKIPLPPDLSDPYTGFRVVL